MRRKKQKEQILVVNSRKTVQHGIMPGETKWVDVDFYKKNSWALKDASHRPWLVLGISKEEWEAQKNKAPAKTIELDVEEVVKEEAEDKPKVDKPKGKIARQVLAQAFVETVGSVAKAALLTSVPVATFDAWTKGSKLRSKGNNVKKLDWYKLNAFLNYDQTLLFKENIIRLVDERLENK